MITKLQALEACNWLNTYFTLCEQGTVQGYRGNWLLRATYNCAVPSVEEVSITLTFATRSSFSRHETFPITIGYDILALCRSTHFTSDVLAYYRLALLGTAKECKAGHERWMAEREEVS